MSERRCDQCRFWAREEMPEGFDSSRGECRRREPSINIYGTVQWPETREEQWCGEFQEPPGIVCSRCGESHTGLHRHVAEGITCPACLKPEEITLLDAFSEPMT